MTDDPRPPAAASPPSPTTSSSVRRLPELTPRTMWTTAIVIAVLTAAAVVALWWPATAGLTGADLVKARLDALKIGLSIGVGSGGVVALYLAWRRQHSTEADLDNRERALVQQERAAADVRADATERRITELYTKAVEQLGSDKAPVRLGGLYALERLAQDNESQRQTIVNVLCAYLRMPYELPKRLPDNVDADQFEQHRALVQEREVRLTAQRLLGDHLQPRRATAYWGELDLDLTGAQLIDFDLPEACVGTGTFSGATFTGRAIFSKTIFAGAVDYEGASFVGSAFFQGVTFIGRAGFSQATFSNGGFFQGVTFNQNAAFDAVTFDHGASFLGATFAHLALFAGAVFSGTATFSKTKFSLLVNFGKTTFGDESHFDDATANGKSFRPDSPQAAATIRTPDENKGSATMKVMTDDPRPLSNTQKAASRT